MIQIFVLLLVCIPFLVLPLLIGLMGTRRIKYLSFFLGIGAFVTYFVFFSIYAVAISLGDSPSLSKNLWYYICLWSDQHLITLDVIALISTIIMMGSLSLLIFELWKSLLLFKYNRSIQDINLRLVIIVSLGLIMAVPIGWLYGIGFFTRSLKIWLLHE